MLKALIYNLVSVLRVSDYDCLVIDRLSISSGAQEITKQEAEKMSELKDGKKGSEMLSSKHGTTVVLTTQDLHQNEHRVLGLERQIWKQGHFSSPSCFPWVQPDQVSIIQCILQLTR